MTDRFDRLLRRTVEDLAGDADVITDRDRTRLAVHAIDRAYALRACRRGVIAVLVALVTALAVGIPYGLRYLGPDTGSPPVVQLPAGVPDLPGVPTHVIDDTSKPIELVDGWFVAGNRLVLNPQTRTYESFGNVRVAMLSPNGRWVATTADLLAYRVYDLQRGGSVRYDVASDLGSTILGPATWSPAGDTLLVPVDTATSMGQFIDVATQTVTHIPGDATSVQCPGCLLVLTWLPSGAEVAAVVGNAQGVGTGLQTFAPDGTPGTLLPLEGVPAGVGAWSPDGRHVVLSDLPGNDTNAPGIVDVATGEVVRRLGEPTDSEQSWPITQAQWIDDSRVLTWAPIVTDAGFGSPYRAIASLWSIEGRLLERWIPPVEIVRIDPGPTAAPLAIHLG